MATVTHKSILPKVDVYLDVMQRLIVEQLQQGSTTINVSRMSLGKLAYTLINETGMITYAVVKPD